MPGDDRFSRQFNVTSYFLDRNLAKGYADRTALICEDTALSYARLAALTNRIGNVLRELGVRRGDRVLLAMADGVEFIATWYAVQKIGAVTAEVYTFLTAKDYAYYLSYTQAAVVVTDVATLPRIRGATSEISLNQRLLVVGPVEVPQAEEFCFDILVAEASDELDPAPTAHDDVAIWKFTTGSTGKPKACVHPTASPLHSFLNYAQGVLDLQADDVVLPVPKLFFGYARDLATLFPFGVGGTGIVFPQRSTPERIFELIARHRPTVLVNVPTMMSAMLEYAASDADLSCLRLCTSAGEALPAELYRRWRAAFGTPVLDGIGSSEAYHIYISNRPGRIRAGSAGQVVPGYAAEVIDESGVELPAGEIGRLAVTGPTTALEYWQEPEKSRETFIGDTVRTGDLFSQDVEGYFYYRGRADDLLKVSGVWVAPTEIEHCLLGHPDILECAVVGHSSEGLMVPRAYVVSRAASKVSEADIQDFVRARLSPHKYPRQVRFVTELPKTGSGKIDRRALRSSQEKE